MIKQLPIALGGAQKSEVRTQFAALCYRIKKDKVRILLVTSRGSKRWIVPKGWPMDGKTPAKSALQEAWEEAGVVGSASDAALGVYSYAKCVNGEDDMQCLAMVYPIEVTALSKEFPEKGQRRRKWMSRKKAASKVSEPELARIIRDFDPRRVS